MQFGITDPLQDPTIELHAGNGSLISFNDNWKDTKQAAIMATGKAPPDDKETAILSNNLAPGSYTAIVRGKNNTTGVGLVEAYDLDQASATILTNISTRGFVDTDQEMMIAGFIAGNGIVKVIVRGLGPTLSQFGVPNVLADPTLEVRDKQGTLLASNDNWKATQQAEIQASGKAPPNDNESAISLTSAGKHHRDCSREEQHHRQRSGRSLRHPQFLDLTERKRIGFTRLYRITGRHSSLAQACKILSGSPGFARPKLC